MIYYTNQESALLSREAKRDLIKAHIIKREKETKILYLISRAVLSVGILSGSLTFFYSLFYLSIHF